MSFLGGVIVGAEGRSGTWTLEEPGEMLETLTGGRTYTGRPVSIQGALRFPAVLDCVVLVSSSVGGMPLIVYRSDSDGGKIRDRNHPTWPMLHDNPNPEMSADEVWEIVVCHLLLWGNAYMAKVRDSLGIVRELWPISPHRVSVNRDAQKRKVFHVDGAPFYSQDILHFRGLSSGGLVGLSPIQLCRQTMGIMAAQEKFQGEFLRSDGKPNVILRHPKELSEPAAKRLKVSWDSVKAGGAAILEEGIEVDKWTMPLDDAQFLEQHQFSDLRVAQMFQVPAGKIGAKSGDSLTYSTNEQNGIDLVTYTLGRWMKRIEGGLKIDPALYPRSVGQASSHFPEFLADGLLRTDVRTRYSAYMLGIKAKFLTVDEVRQMENRPALTAEQIAAFAGPVEPTEENPSDAPSKES
ncbi:MAG TPA: phage portal protein [Solirubrobacterales bacterium]|nr:phage portal protein [Solirubrobacterales bacterium]